MSIVEALVQAGASRIYATARSIESLTDVVALAPDRIIPIALDVTDLDRVNAVDKAEPISVAQAVLQAVEAGLEDVYPDPVSQSAFAAISEPKVALNLRHQITADR
jgi:NADP-dependent 3-hydroxy acid dehydrogenase YdfG